MPSAAEIVLRYSGGAGNTDPLASLGGALSTAAGGVVDDNVLHDIFDLVSGAERLAGDIEYRGIYVRNEGADTLFGAVIWISSDTTAAFTELDIALAAEAVNATMATIANESTAPGGVTFSHPSTEGTGLSIGDIPAGQMKGIWLRRTVSAGSTAQASDTCQISVAGDSAT